MSVPIQNSAPDQLPGGEQPLTSPDRRGNESAVNQLSFCRGVNVEVSNGRQSAVRPNNADGAASRPSESVSGMSLGGRAIETAQPVDRRTIEGSTPGDFRAQGSPAVLPNQPGPRDGMGQVANGRNCQSAPASKPFTGSSADSDAGN